MTLFYIFYGSLYRNNNNMSSDKKVALITGSTAGIGLSCAHALAKRGVNVIVSGSRDASAVGEILEDLKRLWFSSVE